MEIHSLKSLTPSEKQSVSFWADFLIYVGRMKSFNSQDWLVYTVWIGLMFGLLFAESFFLFSGHFRGVTYPGYVWNILIGTLIFVGAIAIDTIGHRTVYKQVLQKGEALIHHITIFSGITSVMGLCLAYEHPDFMEIPVLVLMALSLVYSLFDEALHWHRYLNQNSDRVEMWSHFFILLGHSIMIFSWWKWFQAGYPGVKETLEVLKG